MTSYSTDRKRFLGWVLVLGLVAILALPTQAPANVFASKLEMSAVAFAPGVGGTVTLSYILNENADTGVTLKVYRASGNLLVRTVNLGAQTKGTQSWVWDGKNDGGSFVALGEAYYFTVTASDDGYSAWTKISVDADRCKFYSPRGLDVNKNPASKYYGRIYVAENTSGVAVWTGSPKVTTDGIYILNADCTDAVGQGDTARTAGTTWSSTSTSSPWRCAVGEDDNVYLCDWTDSRPALYAGDPDFNTGAFLLDPAGAAASGLTTNHGSVEAVRVKGIGPTRVVYTCDEDYPGGAALGSVWQYNCGNNAMPWWAKPDGKAYDDLTPNRIQNYTNDFVFDGSGNIYVTQDRSDGYDIASVIKVNVASQSLIYHSLVSSGGRDPLRNTRAIALDEARNRVALGTYNMGRISVLDTSLDVEKIQILGSVGTWAVGDGGTIVKSTDRGATWAAQTSTTTSNLYGVNFASYLIGVAVGAGGTILRTSDGGTTWAAKTAPGTADLYCVKLYSTTGVGWAVGSGGAIYKTADGGNTWTATTSGVSTTLRSVDTLYAVSAQAYVCGNGGVILKTTDTGASWAPLTSGTTEDLNSIGMARTRSTPLDYGWAVGNNGTILRTIDAGATWTAQTVPAAAGKNFVSVHVISGMVAKALAEDGTVFRTKDGGTTWNAAATGGMGLTNVRFLDPGLGFAVGGDGQAFLSSNGGATWTAQTTGVTGALNGSSSIELPDTGTTYPSWRGVAFDAAGNLYGIDPMTENLRIYSPPDGANSSTTKSWGTIVPTGGDLTGPSVPVVTDDGAEQLSNQTLHATWTASTDAESGVVGYACAISGVPYDMGRDYAVGWTEVGNVSTYTFTGLDLVNGTYYFLVKAKNGAGIWGEAGVADGISLVKTVSTIGEIKESKDTGIYFMNAEHPAIVTFVHPGDSQGVDAEKWFWVESWDRTAGLKVNAKGLGDYFPVGLAAGSQITKMKGTLVLPASPTADTVIDATRELQLTEVPVVAETTTDIPAFLAMNTKSFGGGWRSKSATPGAGDGTPAVSGYWSGNSTVSATGLNTEGMVIRLTGTVRGYGEDEAKGWMWLYLDDGSGVPNDTGPAGSMGVKVIRPYTISYLRDFAWPASAEDIGKQMTIDGICCNRWIAAVTGPPAIPSPGRIRMLLMRTMTGANTIDQAIWVNP